MRAWHSISTQSIRNLCCAVMFILVGLTFFEMILYAIQMETVPTMQSIDGYNIDREEAMQQGLREEFANTSLKLFQMQVETANQAEMIRTMLAQVKPN